MTGSLPLKMAFYVPEKKKTGTTIIDRNQTKKSKHNSRQSRLARFYKKYGLRASHRSMETPANPNHVWLKF